MNRPFNPSEKINLIPKEKIEACMDVLETIKEGLRHRHENCPSIGDKERIDACQTIQNEIRYRFDLEDPKIIEPDPDREYSKLDSDLPGLQYYFK